MATIPECTRGRFTALAATLAVLFLLGNVSSALAQPSGVDCPRKRLCINVVVDGNGCPSYTTFEGVKDKVPNLSKQSARRMNWYMVNEAGAQQQIPFKIYFDPFKKPELDGTGMAQSQRLDKHVPVNVNFKYTVVVESCPPYDPMIRILR